MLIHHQPRCCLNASRETTGGTVNYSTALRTWTRWRLHRISDLCNSLNCFRRNPIPSIPHIRTNRPKPPPGSTGCGIRHQRLNATRHHRAVLWDYLCPRLPNLYPYSWAKLRRHRNHSDDANLLAGYAAACGNCDLSTHADDLRSSGHKHRRRQRRLRPLTRCYLPGILVSEQVSLTIIPRLTSRMKIEV